MADETQITEEEALALVKPSQAVAVDEMEFDGDSYGDTDEIAAGYLETPTQTTEEGHEAEEDQSPSPEMQKLLAESERIRKENEELRRDREKRDQEDFERRLTELPEDQKVEFIKKHYAERDRAREVESLQSRMSQEFPVAAALIGPFSQQFQIEVDDPETYRAAMASLETSYTGIIEKLVNDRLAARLAELRGQKSDEWQLNKLGGVTPKAPAAQAPVDPATQAHAAAVKRLRDAPGRRVDDVQELLRTRNNLKRQSR